MYEWLRKKLKESSGFTVDITLLLEPERPDSFISDAGIVSMDSNGVAVDYYDYAADSNLIKLVPWSAIACLTVNEF